MKNKLLRQNLQKAGRVIVKIGSRVLVQRTGRPDVHRMKALVKDVVALRKKGYEVVLVSSGAIGTGVYAMGMTTRPTTLPELQMAAAVGQTRLMTTYDQLFAAHGYRVGQVLLTHGDLNDRRRHLNARNTMLALLRHDVIPIVNENDVVAVDEIRFGDNDLLASLVTLLIQADVLILLTTVDGFRMPSSKGRTRRVPWLEKVTDDVLGFAVGKGSALSTGGMSSKLQSAAMAAKTGVSVVIANGRTDGILTSILDGKDVGTLLAQADATATGTLNGRKRWIAFFHKARGTLVVDDGAREAILRKGRSLLPIGIREVEGSFDAGSVVNVQTLSGQIFARGLADFSSTDLQQIKGHKTTEIESLLGCKDYEDVIHRDNMVVFDTAQGSEKK